VRLRGQNSLVVLIRTKLALDVHAPSIVVALMVDGTSVRSRSTGGECHMPRCPRNYLTTRGSPITLIGFGLSGHRSGSTCQTRKIKFRHLLEGNSSGGGDSPGPRRFNSGGRRWRASMILLAISLLQRAE